MNDAKVYLLFTNTGTILTRLIKLYTKHPLNHVSIAFDEQLTDIYSFGRKKPYNPFIGGFVKEQKNEGLMKRADCAIYSLRVTKDEFERMIAEIKKVEEKKELYKYNLIGLFAIMLNKRIERKYAFFCSEFVATVLNVKQDLLRKVPSLSTPQDLMYLDDLKLVYQGKLSCYSNYYEEISINHQLRAI